MPPSRNGIATPDARSEAEPSGKLCPPPPVRELPRLLRIGRLRRQFNLPEIVEKSKGLPGISGVSLRRLDVAIPDVHIWPPVRFGAIGRPKWACLSAPEGSHNALPLIRHELMSRVGGVHPVPNPVLHRRPVASVIEDRTHWIELTFQVQ